MGDREPLEGSVLGRGQCGEVLSLQIGSGEGSLRASLYVCFLSEMSFSYPLHSPREDFFPPELGPKEVHRTKMGSRSFF